MPVVPPAIYMGGSVHLLPWEENTTQTQGLAVRPLICRTCRGCREPGAVGIKTQGTWRVKKPRHTSAPGLLK